MATTYYVSTYGDDNDPGTQAEPWRTVTYGQGQLTAGDVLIVEAGTYYEPEIDLTVSGTEANRITIQGELDAQGNRLTIINGAVTNTSGQWVHDPSLDNPSDPTVKVYKNTTLGYRPSAMVTGAKTILDVGDSWMPSTVITCAPVYSAYTGLGLIASPAATEFDVSEGTSGTNALIQFWELVHALYGWDSATSTVYLRFRDGSDPNTKGVRVAASGSEYCIDYQNNDYVTLKDLKFMGCDYGVDMYHSGQVGNTLKNCEVAYSTAGGVHLGGNSVGATVENNDIYIDLYGRTDPGGPWDYAGTSSYGYDLKYSKWAYNYAYYRMFKCVTENTTDGTMHIEGSFAQGAKILDNKMHNGRVGVNLFKSNDCEVSGNEIYSNSSAGIHLETDSWNNEIKDNLISNNNLNFRVHNMSQSYQKREYYIFCNKAWNAAGVGVHIYVHATSEVGPLTEPGIVVFEGNQFRGARMGISVSSNVVTNGGMPRFTLRRNVFAPQQFSYVVADFYTTAGMMQDVDCNAIYNNWHTSAPPDPETGIPWWGPSNSPEDSSNKFVPGSVDPNFPWDLHAEPDWNVPAGTFLERCDCNLCD